MTLAEYLIKHPKKYLIFDLDHTLAKLNIDWSTIRREIFDLVATFDEPLSKSVPFVSNAGIELSNKAVKKHGKEVAKKIRTFVEEYEMTHYQNYESNQELLNFIRNNKQTYVYYMWTSNGIRTIQDFLNKEDFSSFFSKIVTQNDVSLIKPEAEGFTFLYTPGESLSSYLMIGDSPSDENAAKNAGIDFFKEDYFSRH
ncbi:MAG: HAD hydrolase-like protein [Microgenomates group bacterium]